MDSSIFGTSPRWLFLGDLLNPNKSAIKISDKMRSFVLIIDSEEELSVGIGRRLDVKPLSYNETYVTSSALRGLNISVGDPIILNLDIIGLFLS